MHDNLRNLGLDVLDVVNLRVMVDVHGPAEGSHRGAAHRPGRAAAQGLIRHIGLSNVTPAQVAEAARSARSSACRTTTTWRTATTTR